MELFTSMMETVLDIFQIDFTIFGITLNFWQVFLFCLIAGVVAWFVGVVISGG